MRKALNENPLLQAALVGVLAIIVGFLLLTRVMGQDEAGEATPASDAGAPVTESAPAPAADSDAAPPAGATSAPESSAAPGGGSPTSAASGFESGPGLPAAVVDAYDDGKAVVLLITRERGIDDRRIEAEVNRLRGRSNVAVFETHARNIARYSRITQGVNVDRTPALVVVRPKRVSDGQPTASVAYGFRGPESVEQAVRDALYDGRENLPYYPE